MQTTANHQIDVFNIKIVDLVNNRKNAANVLFLSNAQHKKNYDYEN